MLLLLNNIPLASSWIVVALFFRSSYRDRQVSTQRTDPFRDIKVLASVARFRHGTQGSSPINFTSRYYFYKLHQVLFLYIIPGTIFTLSLLSDTDRTMGCARVHEIIRLAEYVPPIPPIYTTGRQEGCPIDVEYMLHHSMTLLARG